MPVLVVQMGHVPRTTGSTGTQGGGVTEQDYARWVAAACGRLLAGKGGWSVRPINADVPDASYRGDAFVAVHCNGSLNANAHGASVGWQSSEGSLLGGRWKTSYAARGWSRGFEGDNNTANLANYYGVRKAIGQGNRRAVIVECGYLTNSADREALVGLGIDRVALAIGDAVGIPHGVEDVVTGPVDLNPHQQVLLESSQLVILQDTISRVTAMLTMVPSGATLGDHNPQANALAAAIESLQDDVTELKTMVADLVGAGVVLRGTGEITVRAETP